MTNRVATSTALTLLGFVCGYLAIKAILGLPIQYRTPMVIALCVAVAVGAGFAFYRQRQRRTP